MPAKSKAQQRFFGMIDAYKKGKMKHAPKKIRDAAKHISDEDARDFAKTKHEGLPEKVAHIICSRRMEKKAFLAPVVNLIKNPAVLKAAKIGYKGLEGAAALGSALYGISWLGGNIIHPGSGFRENMGLPKRMPKAPKVSPPPALGKVAADDNSHLGRNGMIAGALAGGGLEALLQNEAFKMNGMNRSYLTNNATLRDAYNALSKGRKGTYGKAFSDAANKFKGFVNRPWVFKDEMRALGDPLVNLGEAFGNIAGKFSGSIRKDMLKLKLAKVMTRGGNIAAKAGVGAAAVGVPMALLGAMTRSKKPTVQNNG